MPQESRDRGQSSQPTEAQRAAAGHSRWINSPGEHADHPGRSLATRNHEVIKRWVEERGGTPATAPGSRYESGRPGVLRIDFPGYSGGRLEQITWEEWFSSFDERGLIFIYQEETSDGRQSNFFRLNNPNE